MHADQFKDPIHIEYANEVMRTCIQTAEAEFGLVCVGTGGGMPRDIEMIHLKFHAKEVGNLPRSRQLVVEVTEMLVKAVNDHKKIQPYLRDKPFTASRTLVAISMEEAANGSVDSGNITHAFQAKGRVFYDTNDSSGARRKRVLEESYEEAVRRVRLDSPQSPK